MKKLMSCLLLFCLVLMALPASAQVYLSGENALQSPVALALVNQVHPLPDGNLLVIASGEATADGSTTRYALCAAPDGTLLWHYDLCVDHKTGFPYALEVALLPEGIVIEGTKVDYYAPENARLTWRIGYDGTLLTDAEASLVPTDRVCHVYNKGAFCMEMAYVYDEADAFFTRITHRETGAVWEDMLPAARYSCFALGDRLLLIDMTSQAPALTVHVFDAQCRLFTQYTLSVEGEVATPYAAIETADTLYLLINTANGGKPWRYTVVPVDKASALPGDPVGIHTLPGVDDTAASQIACGDGMLELFGHQPVWGEPYYTQLRHVTKDGAITVLADITGRPYLFATLDVCFLVSGADGHSAVFLHRDEGTESGYCLKTYAWDAE